MNKLPDGEHLIDGKIYVVKDGEITEIRDAQVVEASEEVALEDTVVEETVTDNVEETTMAIDPTADAEAILAIVKPAMDEQLNTLLAMIAELKSQLEEVLSTEVDDEVIGEAVAMSVQHRLSTVNKFINK
jgi:hypothetical protein